MKGHAGMVCGMPTVIYDTVSTACRPGFIQVGGLWSALDSHRPLSLSCNPLAIYPCRGTIGHELPARIRAAEAEVSFPEILKRVYGCVGK